MNKRYQWNHAWRLARKLRRFKDSYDALNHIRDCQDNMPGLYDWPNERMFRFAFVVSLAA